MGCVGDTQRPEEMEPGGVLPLAMDETAFLKGSLVVLEIVYGSVYELLREGESSPDGLPTHELRRV